MTFCRQLANSNVYGYPIRNDVHISAGLAGTQLLVEARHLSPAGQQQRQCTPDTITLEAPAGRVAWKQLYRMARTLARRGTYSAKTKQGRPFTLMCNNRRVRFCH